MNQEMFGAEYLELEADPISHFGSLAGYCRAGIWRRGDLLECVSQYPV